MPNHRFLPSVSLFLRLRGPLVLALTVSLVATLGLGVTFAVARLARAATTTVISTCDYPTLSAAIDAAYAPDSITPTGPGDTLKFACSGTISVPVPLYINKSLTLDA